MYVLQLAKLSGADITIAIGRTEEKLQLAQQKFGADGTINITKERLHEGIKRISTGKGVDVMFDFVVNRESVENSIRVLKNSGKLILVGVVNDQVIITPKRITLKEVSVVGSSVGSKNELQLLVDLAEKRKLLSVTSVRHRLDQVNEALRALKEGKIIGRGYIDPLMQ
jgi:D-arabinose 1-dehydrogenase-like Zn-dependent alcohol dehydrogenase